MILDANDDLVEIDLKDNNLIENLESDSDSDSDSDSETVMSRHNCIICNDNKLEYALFYCIDQYKYCKSCFHIQKCISFTKYSNEKFLYNPETFKEYVLSKIININFQESKDIKILVLNDTDTKLIDSIYNKICEKISKYRLKTVSVSPHYNNSFFSPHKHSKYALTEYISETLKNEWGEFDVIILNDILTYCKSPCEILRCCKSLSNKDTIILSVNLHTSTIYNMELLNIDKNVNNIFNTNCLKKACCNADLKLEQALLIDNNWLFSTIMGCNEEYVSKSIASKLYEEITQNIYENASYEKNNVYWNDFFKNLNSQLRKYSDIGYQIILIGNLPDDKRYGDIEYDKYLQTKDLQFIDNLIGDKFTILIVTDYKNTKYIRDTIRNYSKKSCIIYDLVYCIGYELEAMSF